MKTRQKAGHGSTTSTPQLDMSKGNMNKLISSMIHLNALQAFKCKSHARYDVMPAKTKNNATTK